MRTVLFVCTGNTCRSPLAEAIAQHWVDRGVAEGGEEVLAASAGVSAAWGMPAAEEAERTLAALGIEHEGRSKPLTPEMVRGAAVVFGMTASHVRAARDMLDGDDDTVVLPLDPDGDIDDPIGMGQDAYDRLARRFMELIPRRLQEVLADENRVGS